MGKRAGCRGWEQQQRRHLRKGMWEEGAADGVQHRPGKEIQEAHKNELLQSQQEQTMGANKNAGRGRGVC